MSDIFDEISHDRIHQRDKFQLELKSEYAPVQKKGESSYTSEFFIFIPTQLQINRDTYTKKQFYRDLTSMIRYKTPVIPLEHLVEEKDPFAPFTLLKQKEVVPVQEALFEIKLFANIVRSQIRDRVTFFLEELEKELTKTEKEDVKKEILTFTDLLEEIRRLIKNFSVSFFLREEHVDLKGEWGYVDEFLSVTMEHYLALLLQAMRKNRERLWKEADEKVSDFIKREEEFRARKKFGTIFDPTDSEKTTKAIYRMGLLNKYIFDVLFLSIVRKVPKKGATEVAAAFAAGLAMFIYLILLTWQGTGFVIDSTAFIVFTVLLYILKDRIKEGVRTFSTRLATTWYPDYTTDIQTKDTEETIGRLKEYMSFLEADKIPSDILKVREREFHDELERIRRLETVIYFKKDVEIWPEAVKANKRLKKVNDIFRYNLSQYCLKASDSKDLYPFLNPETNELEPILYAKVYHVNIILKKTYRIAGNKKRVAFDKFRVILDKEGIQKIEKV